MRALLLAAAVATAEATGATVEVAGLRLVGEDPVGVLAVRALVVQADAAWRAQFDLGDPLAVKAMPTLELRTDDGARSAPSAPGWTPLTWDAGTTEEGVLAAVAPLWWNARQDGSPANGPGGREPDWFFAWMIGTARVAADPAERERWIARAGEQPARLEDLAHVVPAAHDYRGLAQAWLFGEWMRAASRAPGARAFTAPEEADWAAFFLHQTRSTAGPFLGLDESARRLEALGRIDVRRRGEEARVWLTELPPAQRRDLGALVEERRAHLQALLPQVHPVFHRATVALLGALSEGAEAPAFARAFPAAWGEARTTAGEIGALLAE